MRRGAWVVLLAGCHAASAKPARVPTPSEVCAHLASLQGATSTTSCVDKLEAWRAESPTHYTCAAPCMRAAGTKEAVEACFSTCPIGHDDAVALDAEASRNLGVIHTASISAYQHDERFCPSSPGPAPGTLAAAAKTQPTKPADWAAPTWKCLQFELEGSIAYQYEYTSNGLVGPEARYVAVARRRLPGGRTRTFRLVGLVTKVGQVVREDLTTTDE